MPTVIGSALRCCAVLRQADPDKHTTVLAMQPMQPGAFRQELLGYSLMAALGIRAEEINEAQSPLS